MNLRLLLSFVTLACFLSACPSPEESPDTDSGKDPEPEIYNDTGTGADTEPEPLGELCQVKVLVTTDTRAAAPTLEAFDLTDDRPLERLDRSSSTNHYFDAPIGHDVEFTILSSGAAPVAPLTYQATVDQRCASIGELEFFTPIGLGLEPLDAAIAADKLPPVFVDVAAGLLLARGTERWHAVETVDSDLFNIRHTQTDEVFETLPPDARFTSLSAGRIVAEGSDAVVLLFASPGVLTSAGVQAMPTPLQVLLVIDETRAIAHDADGGVWELTIDEQLPSETSWSRVTEAPQQSVDISDRALWMLDETGVVRTKPHASTSVTTVGTPSGGPVRITVNAPGTRLLGWFGEACQPWVDRCGVALWDAADLSPIVDTEGAEVTATDIVAATNVGVDFVLAAQTRGVRVLHIEDDQLVEGAELSGNLAPERSVVLDGALAISTDRRVTFARASDANLAYNDGQWDVIPRTDDFIELIERPCRDPLTCERVLWFGDYRGRGTQPGSTLLLGREFDIAPVSAGDAYDRIDFSRDGRLALTSMSIPIEPLVVPYGAPCLPIVDTTIAVERFTPVRKGLHCITWWD